MSPANHVVGPSPAGTWTAPVVLYRGLWLSSNFSDVRDMCGSFLGWGEAWRAPTLRRYAKGQFGHTSHNIDAVVARTVNPVLHVAQTTSGDDVPARKSVFAEAARASGPSSSASASFPSC